jgi:hypothetical protein
MIGRFAQSLKDDSEDMGLIHQLFYTFSAPPDDSSPIGRWQDPMICFIAITNLLNDGSFKHVFGVTKDFSKWEYSIRSSVLYEISLHDSSISEMERYTPHPLATFKK